MNLGISIVWSLVAAGALGFGVYRWLKWRKDDARAKQDWQQRVNAQKKR